MKLEPEETILTGQWLSDRGEFVGDSVCKRIEWLTQRELQRIASSPQWGDWEILYIDPTDGRYWELTYPHGEMQGGGPPQLQVLAATDARNKYLRSM
jgi:hypothetical protein